MWSADVRTCLERGAWVARSTCIVLTRRSTLLGLAAVSLVSFGTRDAPAQPKLLDMLPADGAVIDQCPDRVLVRFASGIDSRATRISVVGPTGSSSLSFEGSGAKPMEELSIPVPNQGRGAYSVRWDITAGDGQHVRGRMRFMVRK